MSTIDGLKIPTKFFTKVVGTTFEGRQAYIKLAKEAGVTQVNLRREPTNPYDGFAIAADVILPTGEELQLGYISNKERECNKCGKITPAPRPNREPVCPICGNTGNENFSRDGLATSMAKVMDKGVRYKCSISQFTGGEAGKCSLGVNVYIEALEIDVPI